MSQQPPTAREVRKAAIAKAEQLLPRPGLLRYTPLLPVAWPPKPGTPLRIYGYSVRPAPTGRVLYVVRTPRVAVTAGVDNDKLVIRSANLHNDLDLEELQPRSMESPSGREMTIAGDTLVYATATGRLSTEEAHQIRSVYRRWQTANSVIAEHLSKELEEFFKWLAE